MPLQPYCCDHCGFWQRRAVVPLTCPVCEDFRHPLPPDGYRFRTPKDVSAATEVTWDEVAPGIWMYRCTPTVGIGPCGFLIVRPEGNVAFEGASWYSDAALEHMAALGGVRYLSASHPHVYGALWRVAKHFRPEVVLHRDAFPFAQAFTAQPDIPAWPFNARQTLVPGLTLHHTGGHTPGHTVLHLEDERALFCGDALKFTLAPEDEATPHIGHAKAISCHLAFDAHLPLSHDEIRRYQRVLEPLAFDAVFTPWEVVRAGQPAGRLTNRDAMRRLFAEQLGGHPSADAMPIPMPNETDLRDPEAIRRYRAAAPEGEAFEFPITPLDHTGVPVWTVAQWQADGEVVSGVGYGATDERARIGAWGEMMEGLLVHGVQHLPTRRSSYRALQKEGLAVLDPVKLRLPVGTDYAPDMERLWVEARRYAPGADTHGEGVWVLIEEAAHFHDLPKGYDPLYTPIMNGLGAGDTRARCLQHALLELVQRDGNSAARRAGRDRRPAAPGLRPPHPRPAGERRRRPRTGGRARMDAPESQRNDRPHCRHDPGCAGHGAVLRVAAPPRPRRAAGAPRRDGPTDAEGKSRRALRGPHAITGIPARRPGPRGEGHRAGAGGGDDDLRAHWPAQPAAPPGTHRRGRPARAGKPRRPRRPP